MNVLQRIFLMLRAWWNHKKEPVLIKQKEVEKKVHPVEIFPELAYWKIDDKIRVLDTGVWGNGIKYKGVNKEGNLVFMAFFGEEYEVYKISRFGWKTSDFKNLRIVKEKEQSLLSGSEYMKDINRFQELIKQDK